MSDWARACHGLILSCALTAPCIAKDAEDVFKEANSYTVRIDVSISTAFMEDSKGAGHGAGFLVDRERRWVMTNAHVAGRSPSTLEVLAKDGTRVDAHKIYVDPYIDVAIIELEQEIPSLKEAPMGCDQTPGTGHPVGAYGHPWGLNFTGTQGVISGRTEKWGPTHLQTDTPINGGNSGGPLISMKTGRVIGVNTSSINREEDQNTNFAVPIGQSCRILSLLQNGTDPSPPRIAIEFYDTIEENAELIVARSFLSDQEIQLSEGDEIVAVGIHTVINASELMHWLRGSLDDVQITVRRENQLTKLDGRLEVAPRIIDRKGLSFAGLLFASSPWKNQTSLSSESNIMVHSIERGSAGHSSDVEHFDFIVRVNGTPVRDLEQLRQLLISKDQASDEIQIDFLRFSESYDLGQMFYSVRRNLKWSMPEEIGPWPDEPTTAKIDD